MAAGPRAATFLRPSPCFLHGKLPAAAADGLAHVTPRLLSRGQGWHLLLGPLEKVLHGVEVLRDNRLGGQLARIRVVQERLSTLQRVEPVPASQRTSAVALPAAACPRRAPIGQMGAVHAYMIAADCFSSTCCSPPPCRSTPAVPFRSGKLSLSASAGCSKQGCRNREQRVAYLSAQDECTGEAAQG